MLALLFAAFYARMVRGNMIEAMSEDYIRTARAKGLSERRVVMQHGLRAGLTPIVTLLGLDLGAAAWAAPSSPRPSSTCRASGNYAADLGRHERPAGDRWR